MRACTVARLSALVVIVAAPACSSDAGGPAPSSNPPGASGSTGSAGQPGASGAASGGAPGGSGSANGGSSVVGGVSGASGAASGGMPGSSGSAPGGAGVAGSVSGGAGGGASGSGGSGGSNGPGEALPQHVMTWYTFQDNTPTNSSMSSSGQLLKAYATVAVPFTELKAFGGKLDYGDKIYIAFLDGKKLPGGKTHSGWVEIADFCGDNSDDSYCYQQVGGKKYPNIDLYIGDFTKSGMAPNAGGDDCIGPAGSGQELTDISLGDPGGAWTDDYGVPSLGTGKCGDQKVAMQQQGPVDVCWHYTPPDDTDAYCSDCDAQTCAP